MLNLPLIAKSWYNYAAGNEQTKKLMEERLQICDNCENKKQINRFGKTVLKFLNDDDIRGASFYCGKCGCSLGPKTSNINSHCPIGKW